MYTFCQLRMQPRVTLKLLVFTKVGAKVAKVDESGSKLLVKRVIIAVPSSSRSPSGVRGAYARTCSARPATVSTMESQ